MHDSIKIFIQQHRAAFDGVLPGAHGWPALRKMLDRLPAADGLEREILLNRLLLDAAIPSDSVWTNIVADLNARPSNDPLEQFISRNRGEFDTAQPDMTLWGSLEAQLPVAAGRTAKRVAIHWQKTLLRAAASIVLLATGAGLGIWYSAGAAADRSGMAMSEVSSEYRELEQFYQRDINVKQQQLSTFTGNQPGEVYNDLEQMDAAMRELRSELATVPPGNREQVVRAMIENYKAKTAILQRVLERLEPTKTDQNDHQDHESKQI